MRTDMREQLKTELTRKQFLQYLAGAVLMVFGLDNLISLLTGHKLERHVFLHGDNSDAARGFGSSRFGV